jgi:hypothetical protein
VLHGAAAKKDTDEQIEVGFEQMDDPEAVEFDAAGFLVYHDIDHVDPTSKEEPWGSSNGGKAMDET